MNATFYIRLDAHKCEACWQCLDSCPNGVFGTINFLWNKCVVVKHADQCVGCFRCMKVCNTGAIAHIPSFYKSW